MRYPLLLALALLLAGCDTSSHDVIIEGATAGSDPQSLSVAWQAMEARMSRLETEVTLARDETRRLCLDGNSTHAICQRLAAMDDKVATASTSVENLELTMQTVDERVSYNERVLGPVDYDARTKTVRFTGVNVQIRNGTGTTDGDGDGTGNLIVGWNEADDNDVRDGSHNVVVGSHHAWTGHSSIATGMDHALLGEGGAAIAGVANTAAAGGTALIGGQDNHSSAPGGVAIGGAENHLRAELTTTLGGYANTADGAFSVILGGSELLTELQGEVLAPTSPGPAGQIHDDFPQ